MKLAILLLAVFSCVTASAQDAQTLVQQQPVMRDAYATLQSDYARKKYPATTLKLHVESLPAEITVNDPNLFRTVQYMRAQNPKEQRTPQLDALLKRVMANAAISGEEAVILEAFARGVPLTVNSPRKVPGKSRSR